MDFMEIERRRAFAYHDAPQPGGVLRRDRPPRGAPLGRDPRLGAWQPPPEMPKGMKAIRNVLEQGVAKDPEAFARQMTLSELKKLMDSLDLKFKVGRIAHLSKWIGSTGPADILRLYCQDLVNIRKAGEELQNKDGKKVASNECPHCGKFFGKRNLEQHILRCGGVSGGERHSEAAAREPVKQQHASPHEAGAPLTPEDLYERLPGHTLWKEEYQLKKQLFRWMRSRKNVDEEDPLLIEEASLDKGVSKSETKLLGKYMAPLQEWIERRLPDDIAVGIDDQDRYILLPLIPLDQSDEPPAEAVCDRSPSKRRKLGTL